MMCNVIEYVLTCGYLLRLFLIEEYCRFLSNFSSSTADVELPGEFLTPRHSHYSVKIARFMPRVEIVHKHNTAARRLYIRGSNGKVRIVVELQEHNMPIRALCLRVQ